MGTWSWRSETEGRLRKAQISLEAARALVDRAPPCNDDAVNRASASALQAARALVDARWPPRDHTWDPTYRPGMLRVPMVGPYSKASWAVIIEQFEKASSELGLAFDATAYLRTLLQDGREADMGESPGYEHEEALESVETADKLVRSVTASIQQAFDAGYQELADEERAQVAAAQDESETTQEAPAITQADLEAFARRTGTGLAGQYQQSLPPLPHLPLPSSAALPAQAAQGSAAQATTEKELPRLSPAKAAAATAREAKASDASATGREAKASDAPATARKAKAKAPAVVAVAQDDEPPEPQGRTRTKKTRTRRKKK